MPQPLPFKSLTFISPYWEHFGTARFGRIYYRNTTDPTLLRRVLNHLQDVFPSAKEFSPSYIFLATWANVPQFGILSAGNANLVSLESNNIFPPKNNFGIYDHKVGSTSSVSSNGVGCLGGRTRLVTHILCTSLQLRTQRNIFKNIGQAVVAWLRWAHLGSSS